MAVKAKPAGIFLAIVAAVTVAVLAFFLWVNADPARALRLAFEPSIPFERIENTALDYRDDANWAALPGTDSFATARPQGVVDIAMVPEVDVFYVHPTTYLNRETWNAPLDDADANNRIENRVLKLQASSFNLAGRIFAPRYRQATFGAFFDEDGDGLQAILYAYGDVLNAFDQFIAERSDGRPFILAGHSQGALHLLPLLQQRVAGTPLAERLVAAYVVGWPVSVEADIGALAGVEPCREADQTACIVSYLTYGPGGDTSGVTTFFNATPGLGGAPRAGTEMLCVNPLTWTIGASGSAEAHRGATQAVPDDAPIGAPIEGYSGAACDVEGFLILDTAPGEAWQEYKMAGESFHVYDYHLFYMNIRENAALRAQAWLAANHTTQAADSR